MRQPTEICRSRCCQLAAYLLLRSQETKSVIARRKGGCSTCEESQCEQKIEIGRERAGVCVRFSCFGTIGMLDVGSREERDRSRRRVLFVDWAGIGLV